MTRHAADGFAWGDGRGETAQLALAVLLRFADRETARRCYQAFKWECNATLPQADFRVGGEAVWACLAEQAGGGGWRRDKAHVSGPSVAGLPRATRFVGDGATMSREA